MTTSGPGPSIQAIELFDVAAGAPIAANAPASGSREFARRTFSPSAPVVIRIDNPGSGPLQVGPAISTGTGAAAFQVTGLSGSVTVPPGGNETFNVVFSPTTFGLHQAQVEVTHDATTYTATPLSFSVLGRAAEVVVLATNSTPLAIPDLTTVTSTQTIVPAGFLVDIDVGINITHPFTDDLDITLVAPDGTRVPLALDRGTVDNYTGTILDDEAATAIGAGTNPFTGRFRPEQPLAALFNKQIAGTWRLDIFDDFAPDTGTLLSWTLDIGASAGPIQVIELREGTGTGPSIASNPVRAASGLRNFNLQEVGATTQPSTFVIRNAGTGTITLSPPPSSTNPAEFSVGALGSTSLGAGQETTFTVTFQPGGTGIRSGTIEIPHNATVGATSPFTFAVEGTGLTPPFNNPQTLVSPDTPTAIPDFNATTPTSASATLRSNLPGFIADLNVTIRIAHTFTGDLELSLGGPDGTTILLSNRNGGSGDNYTNTVFDDQATTAITSGAAPFTGSFRPQESLARFTNRGVAGIWTLAVRDLAGGDIGTIERFDIDFTTTLVGQPVLDVLDGPTVASPLLASGALATGNRIFPLTAVGGGLSTATITLANRGGAALTVGPLTVTGVAGTGFGDFAAVAPATIAAGTSGSLTVQFQPTAAGLRRGMVNVNSNNGGAPSNFTLEVVGHGVVASATLDIASTDVPKAIPDGVAAGVLSTINVAATGFVTDVAVSGVRIDHLSVGQLSLFLIAPDGTQVELSSGNGGTGDNYSGTVFDRVAPASIAGGTAPFNGLFQPEANLGNLQNHTLTGAWQLLVVDTGAGTTGALQGWTLELGTSPTAPPVIVVREGTTTLVDDATAAGGRAFGSQTISAGATAATTIEVLNLGGSALTLARTVQLGAGTTAAEFPLGALAATVPPGGSTTFTIAFDPDTAGAKSAKISLAHNAAASPFDINVSGSGVAIVLTVASTNVPLVVPPTGTGGAGTAPTLSTLVVPPPASGGLFILDVNVMLNITHTFDGDLDIFLISPTGTRVELTTDNGGTGDNYTNTLFDDQAGVAISANVAPALAPFTGTFRPEGSLAALIFENAVGTWTLEISDDSGGDVGTLNSWSLDLGLTTTATPRIEIRDGGINGPILTNTNGVSGGQTSIDFGIGSANQTAVTRQFAIRNMGPGGAGGSILDVQLPIVDPSSNNPSDFDIIPVSAFPASIPGGGAATFNVQFVPGATGALDALISIDHNGIATQTTPFTFPVSGRSVLQSVTGAATGLPQLGPDNGSIDTVITIPAVGRVDFVITTVEVAHAADQEVDISLISPNGTQLDLSSDNGGAAANYITTVFDDAASTGIAAGVAPFNGSFRPESPLAILNGESVTGNWTLRVGDDTVSAFRPTVIKFELFIALLPSPVFEIRDTATSQTLAAQPVGAPATGSYAFGNVNIRGAAAVAPVTITNPGTFALTINSITLTSNVGGAFNLDTTGFAASLPVGQSTQFLVRFDPAAAGNFTGRVSIQHTAAAAAAPSPFEFNLDGTGGEAALEVTDGLATLGAGATIDLGSIGTRDGPTSPRTVVVRNTGTSALNLVAPPALSGAQTEFRVNAAGFPTTLAPSTSATFTVEFDPTLVGTSIATITIVHDGGAAGQPSPYTLNLLGNGIAQLTSGSGGGGGGGGCVAVPGAAEDPTLAALLALAAAIFALRRAAGRRA